MATPPLQLQVGMPAPGFVPGNQPKENGNVKSEEEKQEMERLRSQAELWKVYAPEWDLYLAAYEGGTDMASEKNLFKHQRENDEDFLDRVRRVHYLNYCDVIIDFFTNFIFAESIQRDGGSWAEYEDFIKDVDRKGTTLDDYMKSVSDDVEIYGMSYTLVDAPSAPQNVEVVTKQTEKDYDLRPYWVLVHPDEVIDWVVDQFDRFSYLKRKQIIERQEPGQKKQIVEQYTEWYPDVIETSEIDVTDPTDPKLILNREQKDNAFGSIPFDVTRRKRSKRWPFMGNSTLRDFAYNNREIMNITSLLQEFLYRQCFNMLAKEVESSIPLTSQEDGVVGSANVIEFPKGAHPPAYITPPAEPAKFLQSERDQIKQEMFRRAAQDTLNEIFNGEQKSGFSQAQSFTKTVPFIATRADTLERTESRLMALTLEYLNKVWDGKIKYKDRYELTNLTDAITQLAALAVDLQIQSPTFFEEEMKRLVMEYDGKLTADAKAKIVQEIQKTNWKDWFETQKAALIGMPKPAGAGGTSPARQNRSRPTPSMAEVNKKSKKQGDAATNSTR